MYVELFDELIKKAQSRNLPLTFYQNIENVIDNMSPNESIYLNKDSIDLIKIKLDLKIKELKTTNELGIPDDIYSECELLYYSMIEEEPFEIELKNDKLDLSNKKYEQDILYNKPRMKFIQKNINYIDIYFNSRGTNFLMLSFKTNNKIYIKYFFEEFFEKNIFELNFSTNLKYFIKKTLNFSNINGDNLYMMFLKESYNWNIINETYKKIFEKYFYLIDFTHRNNDGDNFLSIYMKNRVEKNNDIIEIFLKKMEKDKDYGFNNINNKGNTILYEQTDMSNYYFPHKKKIENNKIIRNNINKEILKNINLNNETFLLYKVKYMFTSFSSYSKRYRILPELINDINKYGSCLNICQKDIDGKNLLYYCVKNNIDIYDNIISLMKNEMVKDGIKSDNYTKLILEDLIQQDSSIFKDYFKYNNDKKMNKETLLISLIKNEVIDEKDFICLIKYIDIEYINKFNKQGNNFLIYASKRKMYSLIKELFKIEGIDLIQRNKQNYSIFTFILNVYLLDETEGKELFELFLSNYLYNRKYYSDIEWISMSNINEIRSDNKALTPLTLNKDTDLSQIFVLNNLELTTKLFNKIDLKYKRDELIFLKIKYYSINKDLYNYLYNIYRKESIKKLDIYVNKNLNLPKEFADVVFESIYSI